MTRGQSPQASVVDRPTASSRRQISGTSSMRIQWNWTFCRSVRSAVSRANSTRDLADDPQLLGGQGAAVDPDPQHEVLVVQLLRLQGGGLAAVDPGLALGVEAPPAEPAAQVAGVDGGEAAVGVDVLDPGPDVERVVVLLGLLVRVERLAVAERPLTLAAACGRRGARAGARAWGSGSGSVGELGGHVRPRSGSARPAARIGGSAWAVRAGSAGGLLTHHRLGATQIEEPPHGEIARRRRPSDLEGSDQPAAGRDARSHSVNAASAVGDQANRFS